MYTIYQIKQGDTLASVANKVGVPIDELSSINGIMVGTVLNPGEYIVVPRMDNDNMFFKKYTIERGDTIYAIARENNIDPSDLLRLNGLNENDVIYQGEVIFIPREDVMFYITKTDDTLNDVIRNFNVSANELSRQNDTIYLTNDQLIVYKK